MPKGGPGGGGGDKGGGGGGANIFTTNLTGPPPGPTTAGSEEWIELGSIPTGKAIWFGSAQYTSPDKTITFELRTNIVGQSAGDEANTEVLHATSVSSRKGQVNIDLYKSGRLHIATVIGTGVEKYWLRLKSKQASASSYLYSLNYTEES